MKINKTQIIILISFVFFLNSCIQSNVFEKNTSIPYNKWKETFKPSFEFEIKDTSVSYSMFLTMRHTDAYPYSNIWMNVQTTEPGQSISQSIKIEIPLAQADGKWLGRGMNEIWEHQMPLTRNGEPIHFSKKGIYKIKLEQIMRANPLPEVMSIGIRLEKFSN